MATSLALMPDQAKHGSPRNQKQAGSEENAPESSKQRARKSARNGAIKKKPQRGMGVAKLEILRLGELHSLNLPNHLHHQMGSSLSPFTNMFTGVPVQQNAAASGYGRGAFLGLERGLVSQSNEVAAGFVGAVDCDQQVLVDPYRIGKVVPALNAFENSKELSSIPKLTPFVSDRCDICFKHKPINGRRENFLEILPVHAGCDFVGIRHDHHPNFSRQSSDLSLRATKNDLYSPSCTSDQGVEVAAIHRNGSSRVLMEYEFFPGRSDKLNGSPCSESGAASSYAITTTKKSLTCNAVDLSLKLSY